MKLSKEVWNLKSTNKNAEIAWKIIQQCTPVNRAILRCNLSLNEKLEIATHQGINLLNKRPEFVSKCRHFNKLLLINFVMASHGCPVFLPLKSLSRTLMPLHSFYSLAIAL